MENDDFIIDSKDKKNLSKDSRIFHYLFGFFLFLIGLVCLIKTYSRHDNLIFLNSSIVLSGILWIVRGLIGKDFSLANRFINIKRNSITIKRLLKNELSIFSDSIVFIQLQPSKIEIGLKDYVQTFDLTWISYFEFQILKDRIDVFCKENNIRTD